MALKRKEQGRYTYIWLDQESLLQVHIWSGVSDSKINASCVCMVQTFAKTMLVMQVERAYQREQEKAAAKAANAAVKAQRHR